MRFVLQNVVLAGVHCEVFSFSLSWPQMDGPKKKKAKPARNGDQRKEKRRATRAASSSSSTTQSATPTVMAPGSMPLVSVPVIVSGHLGAPMPHGSHAIVMGMPGAAGSMGLQVQMAPSNLSSHAAQIAAANAAASAMPILDPQSAKGKAAAKAKDQKAAGKKRPSYISEIKDMMYTFGDARDSNEETANLIEGITRSHVLDVVWLICIFSCLIFISFSIVIREIDRQPYL